MLGASNFVRLKNGDNHADGHKESTLSISANGAGLRWDIDEIWVRDLSPERPKYKSQRWFKMDWRDVHLDREDLRHCCKIWVFRSYKDSMLMPRATEKLHNWYAGATNF